MGPVGHRYLLGVVSFGNPLRKIFVCGSLETPPGAMLDNELLVLDVDTDWHGVLRLHDLASNCVLVIVHWFMHCHVSGFKHSLFTTLSLLPVLFSEFLSYAVQNICLHLLLFLAEAGQVVCWVESFANDSRLCS